MLQHIANLVRDPAFTAYLASGNFSPDVVIPGQFSTPARPVKLSVQVHPLWQRPQLLLSRDITALEQAEAMRRDFVANVSHEIRTPLTVLSGFVETLQNLPLKKPERDRYLGLMAQQSQRMQTLVNDLLTLSRLEGSPLPGAQEWSATESLLAQCEQEARALSGVIAPQGHHLVFEPGPACEIAGIQRTAAAPCPTWSAMPCATRPGRAIRVSWALLADGRGEFSRAATPARALRPSTSRG